MGTHTYRHARTQRHAHAHTHRHEPRLCRAVCVQHLDQGVAATAGRREDEDEHASRREPEARVVVDEVPQHELVCGGRLWGATVHGTYGTPEAATRTPYVQCVAPRGKLPCASGTYSA